MLGLSVRFINKFIMPDQIAKHITKGGPGDKYLGGGKVDTSSWFREFPLLEDQIRNEDIWFCSAPFQLLYTKHKRRINALLLGSRRLWT